MQQPLEGQVATKPPLPSRAKRRWWRLPAVLGVVAVIFVLGFLFGNGRLSFGSRGIFSKSVEANKTLPNRLNYSSVDDVYRSLKNNFDGSLETNKLLDGIKTGLAQASGDPYTVYFNAEQAKAFQDDLNGTFSGIGAELGKDAKGNLIVVSPISGFPADKAGLKAKDIVTEIDGKTTAGESIEDAVKAIRGPKGTTVKLTVVRDGKALEISIVRDDIKIPSVNYKILDGNIGYVQITQFSDDTASLTQKAADEFKAKKVSGVVLDLRGNPGGLLTSAVSISSLWLDRGKTVVLEKRGNVVTDTLTATGNNTLLGVPTVVLINGGSASASEITAGALRDNKAATLVGEKSFGKGSVQQLINLGDGGQLKVTVAHWFTPNGSTINGTGLTPDKTVTISEADAKAGTDTQLQAAITILNKK